MLNFLVVATMLAASGYYALSGEKHFLASQSMVSTDLAGQMALYREAVIQYFTANDYKNTSVTFATLKSNNFIPTWSSLYTQTTTPIWKNYRDASGIIYVYASSLPAMNINAEIVRLSKYSVTAGVYRSGDTTLHSPVLGDTRIPLAPLGGISIPDGAPLWIAAAR